MLYGEFESRMIKSRAVKRHIIRWSTCDTEGDWHERAFDENSSKNSILNFLCEKNRIGFTGKILLLLLDQYVFCVETILRENLF